MPSGPDRPDAGDVPLRVELRWVAERQAEVTVAGELDHVTTPRLGQALDDAIERGAAEIVVDLAGLTFCDAGGVGCFLGARQRLEGRGGRLRLVRPAPVVGRVFGLVGLGHLLD